LSECHDPAFAQKYGGKNNVNVVLEIKAKNVSTSLLVCTFFQMMASNTLDMIIRCSVKYRIWNNPKNNSKLNGNDQLLIYVNKWLLQIEWKSNWTNKQTLHNDNTDELRRLDKLQDAMHFFQHIGYLIDFLILSGCLPAPQSSTCLQLVFLTVVFLVVVFLVIWISGENHEGRINVNIIFTYVTRNVSVNEIHRGFKLVNWVEWVS
jgi:hypothetical protein